jgi:F-type H+-transporting ATPase subunit b
MGEKLITPEIGTIIWTIITFVILAALLTKFGLRPLLQILEERERTIKDSLEGAERARAEAQESLRQNQELVAGARRETGAIIEQGKRDAETLRGEILAQARHEAQEMVEQGKRQVQFEQKQAMEQLRRQVADLAIQAAERLITRSLDEATQRKLVDDYVNSLAAMRPEK